MGLHLRLHLAELELLPLHYAVIAAGAYQQHLLDKSFSADMNTLNATKKDEQWKNGKTPRYVSDLAQHPTGHDGA